MELNEQSQRFGEWQILADGLKDFEQFLLKHRAIGKRTRVSLVGYGNPRDHRLSITFTNNGKAIRKIIRIDVREGDWREWILKFDHAEWLTAQG